MTKKRTRTKRGPGRPADPDRAERIHANFDIHKDTMLKIKRLAMEAGIPQGRMLDSIVAIASAEV